MVGINIHPFSMLSHPQQGCWSLPQRALSCILVHQTERGQKHVVCIPATRRSGGCHHLPDTKDPLAPGESWCWLFQCFQHHLVLLSKEKASGDATAPWHCILEHWLLYLLAAVCQRGTILAPFLFTLYTSDFHFNSGSWHLQKFSDDVPAVGCIDKENKEEDW